MNEYEIIQVNAKVERLRYDGFRAFLLGRPPTRRLADAFARQVAARGEQVRFGFAEGQDEEAIARELYYWVRAE